MIYPIVSKPEKNGKFEIGAEKKPRDIQRRDLFKEDGSKAADSKVPRKWTILAYLSGDNNLEATEVNNLLQMEKIGSNEELNIVAQLDRRSIPEEYAEYRLGVDGDWDGVRRYYVEKGDSDPTEVKYHLDEEEQYAEFIFKTKKLASSPLQDLGEADMASKETLKDFIVWGMKNFPAENYMVLLMDHGYGFLGSMHDEEPGNLMALPELRGALEEAGRETGRKIDIVGFDACLMGSAETAYELKDVTTLVIGSQQLETVPGWPLAPIIEGMQRGCSLGAASPESVAKMIIDEASRTPFATPTLAAVDTSRMEEVKESVESFAALLMDEKISPYHLRKAMRSAKYYSNANDIPGSDHIDIVDMAEKVSVGGKTGSAEIREYAQRLKKAVKEAVIAEEHSEEEAGSNGLSIYASTFLRGYDPMKSKNPVSGAVEPGERFSYRNLSFALNSKWDELLRTKFKDVS